MLILNQNEVETVLSKRECLDAVEKAFLLFHEQNFHMPDRMHVHQNNSTLLLMPCFTKSFQGTKLVNVNPDNISKNKPAIHGLMALNSAVTGEPLALLNGAAVTAQRTGAVGALGIKYTSKKEASVLGIIGTGTQGFTQAIFACEVRPIKQIFVADQDKEKVLQFINRLEKHLPACNILQAKNSEELLLKSEIIICCTSSPSPVLPNKSKLLNGKSFIGIGSYKPEMKEFPDALYPLLDQVWVDTPFACKESGDLALPLKNELLKRDQIHPLSNLIANRKSDESETTFFKSVGMALFDLVIAEHMYKKAIQEQVGTRIEI